MQFVTELFAPWSRDLTTLEHVQASALGPLVDGLPVPGQQVNLPSDDETRRLITAASAMVESYIRRPKMLLQAQYREYVGGTGEQTIMLSVTPISSIDTITFKGQALTPVDWTVDPTTGILFRPQGWHYTGAVWRDIEDTRLPNGATPDYVIDYTAGYISPAQGVGFPPELPADIEQAMIVTLLQWVQTQTANLTIQRTRIGDFTQTFFAGTSNVGGVRGLPNPAMDMLKPYRRVD